jgi:hypothetical protein
MLHLRNKKRLLAFLIVTLAIAAVFWWLRAGKPRIIVDNQSGQALKSLTVTFDNVKHDLGDIPSGQSRSMDVQIYRDANFELSGSLADGTWIHVTGHYGVFTHLLHGIFDSNLHITVGVGGTMSVK